MKKWLIFGILLSFVCGAVTTHFVETYYSRNQSNAAYAYGLDLLEKREKDKAIAVFNQAIGLSMKNYRPYISLGRIYEKDGRIDFAIEYYQKAREFFEANNNLQTEDKKYIEDRLNRLNNQSKKTR